MRVVSGEAMRYGLRQGDANGKRVRLYLPKMNIYCMGRCIYPWAVAVYIQLPMQYIFIFRINSLPGLKNEKIRRGKMD